MFIQIVNLFFTIQTNFSSYRFYSNSAKGKFFIIQIMFQRKKLLLITAAVAANLAACGSDATSASDTAKSTAADTVYVRDTIYVPADTVYIPIADSAASSNSAVASSSATVAPASSTSTDAASSAEATSSGEAATSSETVASSSVTTSSSAAAPDGDLLWSDEFDGTALDESKWGYNIGTGENGWGNSEREYYTSRPENVYVKDGMLHIRAQKEDYEGSKYTSTRLLTQNKFSFTYGTVEARIALPLGKGIWPAFWMLGDNIDKVSWPSCGEIDIIEAINDESIIYGTHHWSHEGNHAQYGNSTADHHGSSTKIDISEFHNYKMIWNKEFIEMYVDDFMYQKIDIKDTAGDMGTFHKPFFFILNVAVGGSWPGFDIDDSQFPTEMKVDYIRVYK